MTKQKLCLIGGTGFVGSHLVEQLASRYDVVVLSRNPSSNRDRWVLPNVTFQRTDVYDVDQLKASFVGATAVINLVGVLQDAAGDGVGFRRAHVTLVERLLEACGATARNGSAPRLIHVSSLKAGEGQSRYLQTKGEAERLITGQQKTPWTILRPAVIFGPGDSFLNQFATLLKVAPVMLQPCPNAQMQPVYIGDVVTAIERCIADEGTTGQVYELAGPRRYTMLELVDFVRDQLQSRRPLIGLPDGVSRLLATVLNWLPSSIRPFSKDNYLSLQTPSISDDNGLPRLGIRPTPLELIGPKYLARGQTAHRAQRYQRFREQARR